MTRIRLGFYMFTPMIGGAERYLRDLLAHVDRSRFDVTLFYESWPDFDRFLSATALPDVKFVAVRAIEPGGHVRTPAVQPTSVTARDSSHDRRVSLKRRLLRKSVWMLRVAMLAPNYKRLRAEFEAHQVDVLHIVNGGYPGALSAQAAALAARSLGIRRILMSVCNTPFPRSFPVIFERWLDRRVRASVDFFIVPGPAAKGVLESVRNVPERQIEIIPYGVVDPGEPSPRSAPSERPTILMVAGHQKHKGHRYLIEASTALAKQVPGLRVVMIGTGPVREDNRARVAAASLENVVHFIDHSPLDEVLAHMREADVFALPSEMEGLPYVVLHAMSVALPVVCTPVGSLPDVISDGVTGLFVPVGDVGTLTEALRSVLLDPVRARALGDAGRRLFEEKYTVTRMVASHELLYSA